MTGKEREADDVKGAALVCSWVTWSLLRSNLPPAFFLLTARRDQRSALLLTYIFPEFSTSPSPQGDDGSTVASFVLPLHLAVNI